MLTLEIKNRNIKDSLRKMRAGGLVPCVFYGPKEDSTAISVSVKNFYKVWQEAGSSSIISLRGVGEDKEALIQNVQLHPVTRDILHIDFYIIERGKKLRVTVPLDFEGEAPAEKLGGIVVKVIHEIEMDVRPSEIPQSVVVDLTKLENLDSVITIGDLQFPDSAEITLDKTETVASVSQAQDEEVSAEEERTVDDVEVEEKGKAQDKEETNEDEPTS